MATKNKGSLFSRSYFRLFVKMPTGETFSLSRVYNDMSIRDLKSDVEFAAGVPCNMQRLSYLDDGDLLDHTDVRANDIAPGGTIQLRVWHQWETLLEAVASNDLDLVMNLGVGQRTYKTPNSEYMSARAKKVWLEERAFVALFIAAHRGHQDLCEKIIEAGVNIDQATPLGRTALHVASARGHGHIIDLLLERGANINAKDKEDNTALAIASKYDCKDVERHLFLFQWQERARNTKPTLSDLQNMAHQCFDSKLPVWLSGTQGQIYYSQVLPPQEFEGSTFSSPKHRVHCAPGKREEPKETDHVTESRKKSRLGPAPQSYEEWLAQKKKREQGAINKQKSAANAKKLEEEDRSREKELQNLSYENWLLREEETKSGQAKVRRKHPERNT